MLIANKYVVTPSIALYGSLPPDIFNTRQRPLALACHSFLARAAYHGALLHVPMLFYSQIIEAAYATYTQGFLDSENTKILARTILQTNWEYHIPSSDEIIQMQHTLTGNALSGDAEYLCVAEQQACSVITTAAHPLLSSSQQDIVQIQTHPWADLGALEDFPPNNQ
jgi:hypothetical protein